jgi:hypothetical protein
LNRRIDLKLTSVDKAIILALTTIKTIKGYAMKKSSLVKVTVNVFGTVLQYNLIITGIVIGGIAVLAGKKGTGKTIQH